MPRRLDPGQEGVGERLGVGERHHVAGALDQRMLRVRQVRPLGNLGPKSWMMYLLGYLSEDALDDLATFVKIRNLFAHYSEHNSFESQRVRDRCANFKLLKSNVLKSEVVHDHKLTDGVQMLSGKGICLHLVEYEDAMETSKGKFIAVAKLFCAGLELYRDNNLYSKPIF